MKKINYLITIIISVCFFNIKGQINVADFENLTLSPESYWNGSDSSGISLATKYTSKFMAGNITFSNTWNSNWNYWSDGWIYSNNSDSVTSGLSNISSCVAGKGANNSSNYSIGKNKVYFNVDTSGNSLPIDGIYVTNTTYAHNSMRDGDAFAKKFTNADQDYFKLLVTSFNNGTDVDTVEFFLADFTHLDSLQDYIVNDWKYVDLSSLGLVDSIKFSLISSDIGQFGMNTPAFFAIDNIKQGLNIFDFENLSLDTNSFFDGSDLSGDPDNPDYSANFSSANCSFDNIWNTNYDYWKSGWSYSNMTDDSTSGYTNQYSSKAGIGGGGSENYVVGKSKSYITYDFPQEFSALISNSTYTANSMRDGDGPNGFGAKKFTNADQDYLKLHSYGYLNGILIDSSMLYLADFTHTDSTLDYIVNVTPGYDWQYIEIPASIVDSVAFILESSDVGSFGMNTPDYFCMDNVGNNPLSTNIIVEDRFSIYPNQASEFISLNNINNSLNYNVAIYDIFGKIVINNLTNPNRINISNLPKGQYILRIKSETGITNERLLKI